MNTQLTFKQKLLGEKLAMAGLTWITFWVCIALAGPLLRLDKDPNTNTQHEAYSFSKPGTEAVLEDGTTFTYWLGSDKYGRDYMSRLMAGSSISLSVAGISVLISLIIGLFMGAISGYFGGAIDTVISWFFQVVWTLSLIHI